MWNRPHKTVSNFHDWHIAAALILSLVLHLIFIEVLNSRYFNLTEHQHYEFVADLAQKSKKLDSSKINTPFKQSSKVKKMLSNRRVQAIGKPIQVQGPVEIQEQDLSLTENVAQAGITENVESTKSSEISEANDEPEKDLANTKTLTDANSQEDRIEDPPQEKVKLPSFIETEYEVNMGKGGKVGAATIVFKVDGQDHYSLVSTMEAKGLASIFLSGRLIQSSKGLINKSGLQPEEFLYQMTSKPDKNRQAIFDWSNYKLKMTFGKEEQIVDLPEGTQDFLSFMYQFMFSPPLNQMQITFTNGKKLQLHEYAFSGEETLHLKFGDVKTFHIDKTSSESDERTELWLAEEYQNLPVKIRKTEKDGTVYEQVATSVMHD